MPPPKRRKGIPHKLTPQKARRLIRAFQKLGFNYRGCKKKKSGNHHILDGKTCKRKIVIPEHGGKDIPVYQIMNNIKSAGITVEEFLEAIADC